MVYLGYMATEDGKYDQEIKRRIGIARTAFESMAKILTLRKISIDLKTVNSQMLYLVNTCMWSRNMDTN